MSLAGGRIKGITIEINGETTGLEKSLSNVTSESMSLGKELKDVERLLKFDPGNAELIAQKQELLAKQIEVTSQKLAGLKSAQAEVTAQFQKGDIGEEQYRGFIREIEATETALKGYQGQLENLGQDQENLASNTKRLETLFQATGSSVDDYSDILGNRLVSAIKEGRASSDQLEAAINKIGRASIGADGDIGKLKTALDQIDAGSSINDVRTELDKLGDQSSETADQLEDMSNMMSADLFSGAADQISGINDKITDLGGLAVEMADQSGSSTAQLRAALGLTKAEAEALTGVAKDIYHKGFGESLDEVTSAVQTVKTNIHGLNDVELGNITEQAMVLEQTFGSDMNETLRGASNLMNVYGMSAQEAMDLIVVGSQNGLDKTGELGDNLAEYAGLFEESGYSAQEMFNMLQAGMDGGMYNLDKVNDLVKEFGIRVADGSIEQGVTNIGGSFKTLFDEWKAGGGTQKELFQSIANELMNVQDEQQKAAIVSEIFGSLGEDAGYKVIEAMGDVALAGDGVKTMYDEAGGAAQKMNDDSTTPLQELKGSFNELKDSLAPIGQTIIEALKPIVDVIGDIAGAISGMPEVVQTFIVAFGGVLAVVAAVLPIIAMLGAAAGAAGVTIGAFVTTTLLPIVGIIAGIVAAITAAILIFQNWGTIVDWLKNLFSTFGIDIGAIFTTIYETISVAVQAVVDFVMQIWGTLVAWWNENNALIMQTASTIWNGISTVITTILNVLAPFIQGIWTAIQATVMTVWELIKNIITTAMNVILGVIKAVMQAINGDWSGAWNTIKGVGETIWNGIKNHISTVINGIAAVIASVLGGILGTVERIWNGIQSAIEGPINAAKDAVKAAIDAIKGFFNFEFKWPHIPLPHFSISGSANPLDWIKNGVPKLSVDWFAKGGILTKPTVFGQNGNSLMVGGEAGKEAVAPIDTLMGYVRQAVAEAGGTDPALIAAIMALANRPVELQIDGKAFAEAVQEEVAIALENQKNKKAGQSGFRSVRA